jgi:hypothetical protein
MENNRAITVVLIAFALEMVMVWLPKYYGCLCGEKNVHQKSRLVFSLPA